MAHNICQQLGQRIVQLRRKFGLTQEELADRAGVSYKYIQMLEGKKPNKASLVILEKIAAGFEIPLWKLLKFDDSERSKPEKKSTNPFKAFK